MEQSRPQRPQRPQRPERQAAPGDFDPSVLAPLAAAIDGLVSSGDQIGTSPAVLVELHRQLTRLDALTTAADAAFDTADGYVADGARTAAAWIATRCRIPRAEARRRVRLGRALASLPHCREAWLASDISEAHVGAIAAIRRPATAEALNAGGEELLVEQAQALGFEAFARVVEYFAQVVDPDGAEDEARKERARRSFNLSQSWSGTWHGTMRLDPVSGAIVSSALQAIEAELFDAERVAANQASTPAENASVDGSEAGRATPGGTSAAEASAAEASGAEASAAEASAAAASAAEESDPRTPAQRRADALVEMAQRAMTAPADGRRPAPLISVLVDYDTLRGRILELASGTVVTPGSLVPFLDEAIIERAVFGPGSRVEIGHQTRLFSGATRRAIELRDRSCTHPYCDIPADRCQVDHIVEFSKGGPTTQENGRLLCGFHNRLRNQRPPPGEVA